MVGTVQRIAIAAVATALMSPAESEPARLSGSALRGFVAGKTVVLSTSLGSIPISYRDNGTMQGRAGSLALYTGRTQDHGTWWVVADQICQRWGTWLDGQAHCITFRLNGRVVHWRSNNGYEGTATIASN